MNCLMSAFRVITLISTISCNSRPSENLHHDCSSWIRQAFRPATQRQQDYVARLYAGLADRLRLDYLRPPPELAVAFIVFLACNFKSQKSVKSLLSTLIALLDRTGVSTTEFRSHYAGLLTRCISIDKRAPTTQRPPIDVPILRRIIQHWQINYNNNLPFIAAVLFMFTTGVCQSNLFPATQRSFDASRHLIWADIAWRPEYIKLSIKRGKAQQQTSTQLQQIPKAASGDMCLYTTLQQLYHRTRPSSRDPIITFHNGKPIPNNNMRKKWSEALDVLGLHDHGFTLHSLRRGGARFLQDSGVDTGNIASHVGWRSSAMFHYVNAPGYGQTINALSQLC